MSRIQQNNLLINSPTSTISPIKPIQSISPNDYFQIKDNIPCDLKFSLAHYFSKLFAIFMLILLIATIALFIWSNSSNGAWVSLQVYPILPFGIYSNNAFNNTLTDLSFPFAISVAQLSKQNHEKIVSFRSTNISNVRYNPANTLSSFMYENQLNMFTEAAENILYNTNQNTLLPTIKQKSININTFHFSLVSSIKDFWESKAYTLAILIALFSGIWPYVKLLSLIFCWIIPLTETRRERILIFLDQIGKFSFIDLHLTLYMIVLFYADIVKTYDGFGVELKVIVEPDVGINTFVIGTVISMIFSHVFLHLHRSYSVQNKTDMKPELNAKCKPLFLRLLPLSYIEIFIRSIMLLLMICSIWSIIDSAFTAPARYNITGLVGWAVDNPIRSYTPWQIVTNIGSRTDEHTAATPLALALFVTVIFFPILLLVTILMVWFMPMRYKYIQCLKSFMEFCMAWAALDVFALASVAATLELNKVSQWILNQNHARICGPNGIIPKVFRGAECFGVKGYVMWGTYLLIFACISAWILCVYTIYSIAKTNVFRNKNNDKRLDCK